VESDGATEWGDIDIYIVPNFELEISLSVVCVALLSVLGNPQILSHLGDSFLGILDLS
jgi:hypothetical protein